MMNREIKFRCFTTSRVMVYTDIYPGSVKAKEFGSWMQYTGLKDKNGKEIYEGDIIQWEVSWKCSCGNLHNHQIRIGYVQSWGGAWAVDKKQLGDEHFDPTLLTKWAVSRDEEYSNYYPQTELYQVEVIGNIYENKELITDDEE